MRLLKPALIITLATFTLTGCKDGQSSTRDQGAQEQETIMQRAVRKHPTPQPTNFQTREAVVEWMKRMDNPDSTYYVYLMGNNGQQLGYYVAQTRPISACTFLTPPDRLAHGEWGQGYGDFVVQAPALDGVYAGGGCNSYFFFDAATDAYIEIQGLNFFVADQPLSIEADPIRVSTQ